MEDKFNMTREQSIFFTKRNIIDNIYKSARLEGIAVTFPETDAIYNGINVPNLKVDDIVKINNLKHAWQFILDTLDYPLDYGYICQLNKEVGAALIYNAGNIRNIPVEIGGTTWRPDYPIESQIKEEMSDIKEIDNITEKAITLMLYVMRKQMFMDGNKRTAMLAANQLMIQNGKGIISIPVEQQAIFFTMLINYYETNNIVPIKDFIYNECISGMPNIIKNYEFLKFKNGKQGRGLYDENDNYISKATGSKTDMERQFGCKIKDPYNLLEKNR